MTKYQVVPTGRTKRQIKPTVNVELDTTDVCLHFERRNGMLHVRVP